MKPPRICVACHEPLGHQRYWHHSQKPHGAYKSTWCNGPRKTPGGGWRSPKIAIHYRFYGDYSDTPLLCGRTPGWTKGSNKKEGAEVPWSRVNVKLHRTTCEECLAVLVTFLEGRLAARLAMTGDTREAAFERAEGRRAMRTLDKIVNGSAA